MTSKSNPKRFRRFLALPLQVGWSVAGSATLVIVFVAWSLRETTINSASTDGARDLASPNESGTGRASRSSGWAGREQVPFGKLTPIEAWGRALSATLDTIENETDPLERERLLSLASAMIDECDFSIALDMLQLQSRGAATEALGIRLMQRWAETDTLSAAQWVHNLPRDPWREKSMNVVATIWANRDLGAATAWARQLPEEADRFRSMQAVANEAIRSHPVEALQLAVELPADRTSDDVILRATSEWASRDASGATDWARQIEDGILREEVLAGIATAWAETDPQSAAWLVAELSPGRMQSNAVVGVVERWSQLEPELAASWVELFPAGELKSIAIEKVVAQWAIQNPRKADEWQQRMAKAE